MTREIKCPVTGRTRQMPEPENSQQFIAGTGTTNEEWWPNQLNLRVLRQNSSLSDPMGSNFNYGEEFQKLDLEEVTKDLYALMKDSQSWWPADYGTYGPLFIRMAWHSAGTYRTGDGRGGARDGTQRFPPLNSWPDNANLDKARRLLWPIKKKYGKRLSWADLMILAGTVAFESMGLKTIGFGGGREDVWEPQEDVNWGNETTWLSNNKRVSPQKPMDKPTEIANPLAAVQMGLIYVNPEGPNGVPDPIASGNEIIEIFARMAMNEEETVALIAGGHTFGKTHGAGPATFVGPAPEAAPMEQQGLGWISTYKSGMGDDTITSGLEGAWKPNPTKWDMGYFKVLFKYDYELVKSPAGANQWLAKNVDEEDMVVDAHDPTKKHRPMMTTADLSLKFHPVLEPIARNYYEHPKDFENDFAKAWFKLTHRDMGPKWRYLGNEVPKEDFIWQDPIPKVDYQLVNEEDIKLLKYVLKANLSIPQLVTVAWASASTFRSSDLRGGANGARIRLAPQKDWEVNEPRELRKILMVLEEVKSQFDCRQMGNKKVSLADLIVLCGCCGIEEAAKNAGYTVVVPFTVGRNDATQEQTDVKSFEVLEPKADGFRNYVKENLGIPPEKMLIDRAQLLGLTAPEMTVLIGGMRVLGTNFKGKPCGVLTDKVDSLTNDFFVNLLCMSTEWKKTMDDNMFEGVDRKTGKVKWTATSVDLAFGSNSQLRALAEVYASDDALEKFIYDFISAWNKVMNADIS